VVADLVIGELLCDWVLLKLNREQRDRERKKGLDNSGKKRGKKREGVVFVRGLFRGL
jgi:hypothetical protein